MKIYYQTGVGNKKINLDRIPYWMQTGNFLNYSWDYVMSGKRVKKLDKTVKEKGFTITIFGRTQEEYDSNINFLHEAFEKDVLDNIPGRLYFGDYYLKCFVYASEKEEWESGCYSVDDTLSLIEVHPYWVKDHTYSFGLSEVTSNKNKRYAGRYPYRYANGLSETFLINEHYAECNFRMNIYGPCTKPSVYIGGYGYHFNIVLQDGEYLEVDSAAETVTKVMNFGIRANAFHYRNFENTVFRPIQTGRQSISWDGKFSFDIVLFEERSTPKWS